MKKDMTNARDGLLLESPRVSPCTFLDFPLVTDLDRFDADIAILGIPFGMPYAAASMANDQSLAPDAIRQFTNQSDIAYTRNHFDWDLRGPLLDGRDVGVVDCGNVSADKSDHRQHYARAERAARRIFGEGATLITLGGDHGVPIPVMRGAAGGPASTQLPPAAAMRQVVSACDIVTENGRIRLANSRLLNMAGPQGLPAS